MGVRGRRRVLPALALGCALVLGGCQSELYSNLGEPEANQILSVLMSNGIGAEKIAKGKDGFTVAVDNRDMLRAIALLNDRGLPKNTRETIGKVFQKSGLMSSPFEERVRYIYALGEDVASTLSQIDGVVTARVHLVIPDAPQLGQAVKPSSASVFIKHQPGTDLEFLVPQIRRLVSSAIEGLDYQSVTVVLSEAKAAKQDTGPAMASTVDVLPGVAVRDTDVPRFWQIVYAVLIVFFGLAAAAVAGLVAFIRSGGHRTVRRRGWRRRAAKASLDHAVEPS